MTMNLRSLVSAALLTLIFGGLCVVPLQAKKDPDTQRAEIREMRDEVLAELFELKPELKSRVKKAEGYAVFTNVGVNLIFASVAGGKGIVVENGFFSDTETFMRMGSAGLGLGLGVKDFRAVFIFTSEEMMEKFVEKGWDFGAQADACLLYTSPSPRDRG